MSVACVVDSYKDRGRDIYVDYHAPKRFSMIKNSYLLSRIDDSFVQFEGACYFMKLNLK